MAFQLLAAKEIFHAFWCFHQQSSSKAGQVSSGGITHNI